MPLGRFFHYRGNRLYCEQIPVSRIAARVGTPFYLYSQSALEHQFRSLTEALRPLKPLICFAVKSNSNLSVLKLLVRLGAGLDIVSGGELYRARRALCPPGRIVFAGVGKTEGEIREAVRAGIFCFNAESEPELELLNRIGSRMKKRIRLALRINPDVEARTHAKITTGRAENKFGIDFLTAERLFLGAGRYPMLDIKGLHVHIGSQITELAPFRTAFQRLVKFADRLEQKGVSIDSFDLGGGLGIRYHRETPVALDAYGRLIRGIFRGRKCRILLEPGRFISGNSGILVTRALHTKVSPRKNFVVVDAAMNELVRPALYEAYHEIVPVEKRPRARMLRADIVGPVCESGDVLGCGRRLADPPRGALLAILSAGAYGFSMASNYNSRPRPAEILVKGRRFSVIRARETFADMLRGERF